MMRFYLLIITVAAAAAVAGCGKKNGGGSGDEPLFPGARAMWVAEGGAPVTNAISRAELLGLCREWDINRLVYDMSHYADNQYNTNYTAQLAGLLTELEEADIEVFATQAQLPTVELLDKQNHYRDVVYLRGLLEYNRELPGPIQFSGYVENLNPAAMPGWDENSNDVQRVFNELVWDYRLAFMEFAPDLPLGWVLPTRFDSYAWATNLYSHLDFIVVTGNGDTPAVAEASLRNELVLAGDYGRKIAAALDARNLPAIGKGMSSDTFHEEGWPALDGAVEALQELFRKDTSYGGVVLFTFEALRELPPRPEPKP